MDKAEQLYLKGLSLFIGGLEILSDVSMTVRPGELMALIGPNGAGKTSLFNCISGIYHPSQGEILWADNNLAGTRASVAARRGIARTFQHAELFQQMTVLQNLLIGRHIKTRSHFFSDAFFWGKTKSEEIRNREVVEEIIDFLELGKYRKQEASSLPYGVQKIVGLGRALAMEPKLLLLDEPSAGMNRQEKEDLARFILRMKHEIGLSMVWVEHDMQMVGDLTDRITVLNFGTKIAEGTPEEVLNAPQVVEAYLGIKS
ncbi:MAG: ABC transporter ATP-binding protein [Deltaproteobacteria bacterium]|nr:ABC transporter ATP-binding protein [Deltaproteobacteria bacterium]